MAASRAVKLLLAALLLLCMPGFAQHRPRCKEGKVPLPPPENETAVFPHALQPFPASLRVPIIFHVLRFSDGKGANVPYASLAAAVDQTNRAYSGLRNAGGHPDTQIRFYLHGVVYYNSDVWSKKCTTSSVERQFRQQTIIDPASILNIWTCDMGNQDLGWAYYPSSFPETSFWHGIVLHYQTFPASPGYTPIAAYDQGMTIAHEAGHTFGLLHTFENGCSPPGDSVDDTPYEASAHYGGCSGKARDSCPGEPGLDPIQDFMDYSDDSCMDRFSVLQVARMHDQAVKYKPTMLQMLAVPLCVTSGTRGTAPANIVCQESTCLHTSAPDGSSAPAQGWCNARGSAAAWGACTCTNNRAGTTTPTSKPSPVTTTLAPSSKPGSTLAPTIVLRSAVLNETSCLAVGSFRQSIARCAAVGLSLCRKADVMAGAILRAAQRWPKCKSLVNTVLWSADWCKPGSNAAVSLYGMAPFQPQCDRVQLHYPGPCCE